MTAQASNRLNPPNAAMKVIGCEVYAASGAILEAVKRALILALVAWAAFFAIGLSTLPS
mgnify:CR=1 FL=1